MFTYCHQLSWSILGRHLISCFLLQMRQVLKIEPRDIRDTTRRDGVQSDRGRLREENQQIQRTRRSGGERDVHEPQAVLSTTSSAFLWPHVHTVTRHHYTAPPPPPPPPPRSPPPLRQPLLSHASPPLFPTIMAMFQEPTDTAPAICLLELDSVSMLVVT